jgi:hypothetical protein
MPHDLDSELEALISFARASVPTSILQEMDRIAALAPTPPEPAISTSELGTTNADVQ